MCEIKKEKFIKVVDPFNTKCILINENMFELILCKWPNLGVNVESDVM